MNRRAQENVFAGFLFLLFLTMLVLSFDYGPRARLVPVPIATICMALIVVQIVMQNLRSTKDLTIDALELIAGKSAKDTKDQTEQAQLKAKVDVGPVASLTTWQKFCRSELAALGVILVFLALFLTIGPIPATFLFSTGYFMLSKYWSPLRSLINGAICAAVLYMVFGEFLGVQLNRGVLSPYIAKVIDF